MPGGSVGADGAIPCGENELPPVGLVPFSVGVGGGVVAVIFAVVVVVVVEADGEAFWLVAQPATTDPIATRAAPPASAIRSRLTRFELMIHIPSLFCRGCDNQIPRLRALLGSAPSPL